MKKSAILILVLGANLSTFASNKTYSKIQCHTIENAINNINEQLPNDRQISVKCSESSETFLWGMGKKNFKSTVELTAPIPLCEDSEHVYTHKHYFEGGAFVSRFHWIRKIFIEILDDHGIISRPYVFALVGESAEIQSESSLGYIQFPYCEE